jgi:hypothetical protein
MCELEVNSFNPRLEQTTSTHFFQKLRCGWEKVVPINHLNCSIILWWHCAKPQGFIPREDGINRPIATRGISPISLLGNVLENAFSRGFFAGNWFVHSPVDYTPLFSFLKERLLINPLLLKCCHLNWTRRIEVLGFMLLMLCIKMWKVLDGGKTRLMN